MIEFLSSWVKNLGIIIVIVSILEMLLPNNKTKKYIKIVFGLFIILNIISPLIKERQVFSIENFDFDDFSNSIESSNNINENETVNQETMDKKIGELYKKELEKDITKKLEDKGYIVKNIKTSVTIGNKEETKIEKIEIDLEKEENKENKEDTNTNMENKIVEEIQKIKININPKEKAKEETKEKSESSTKNLKKEEIKDIENFLIEEVANLQLKTLNGGKLTVERNSKTMDKDRYSSCSYVCYYIMTYENKSIKPKSDMNMKDLMIFIPQQIHRRRIM